MGAPYWNTYARGAIVGLTRGSNKNHIIRAGLESMAYNTYDILQCMQLDKNLHIKELRVDGGVSRNEFLMQFQSDIINKKVIKAGSSECTVLGTIYMTGLALGYFKNLSEIKKLIEPSKIYTSKMNNNVRKELIDNWHKAVKQTLGEK